MSIYGSLILIASLFGLGLLAIGFGLGYWFRPRRSDLEWGSRSDAIRARQLLECLRNLTNSMTEGVDEHLLQMDALAQQLDRLEGREGPSIARLAIDVVSEIMNSNEHLKDELTSAEIQLQQQAVEIKATLSRALTDSLTELPNRRAFDNDLEHRIALWNRRDITISLILLDIDHFKKLNDSQGHSAGDRALHQIANVLKGSMRAMDLVARFGGEEFAVILPDTPGENAQIAAVQALQAVRECRFQYEETPVELTTSAGVATVQVDESADELIKRADAALYASKDAGRNCGHFHDGSTIVPIMENKEGQTISLKPHDSSMTHSEPEHDLDAACDALRQRVDELLDSRKCDSISP